jgi:hypothetical protein
MSVDNETYQDDDFSDTEVNIKQIMWHRNLIDNLVFYWLEDSST